jgi:hypothetical protein
MLKITISNSDGNVFLIIVLNLLVYLDWLFIYPKCIGIFGGEI